MGKNKLEIKFNANSRKYLKQIDSYFFREYLTGFKKRKDIRRKKA